MTVEELKNTYEYNLSLSDKKYIMYQVNLDDFDTVFNKFLHYIDCSVTISNGMRVIQTINHNYNYELNRIIWLAETIKDEDYEKYLECCNQIEERHNKNLEFEKEVPPIIYDKKKYKSNTKRKRKAKEGDMFPEETKKAKISKAEAKLKAKLVGATFANFKLVKK